MAEPMSQLLMAPRPLQTFGWRYDESLSKDENYLDFALCLSRNSRCDGGHMGCVLLGTDGQPLAVAVNSTLFDPTSNKSDMHAEANLVCTAARKGVSLEGSSIYITMPPCRNCFGLLQAAGVKRIVSRKSNKLPDLDTCAQRLGIEMVGEPQADDASLARVKATWDKFRQEHPEYVEQEKEAHKLQAEQRKLAKQDKKARQQQQREKHGSGVKRSAEDGAQEGSAEPEDAGDEGAGQERPQKAAKVDQAGDAQ